MLPRFSILLVVCLLFGHVPASAAVAVPPLHPRHLEKLILPEVKFRDADLVGALNYLQQKAERHSQGQVRVPFVIELPLDFEPRSELTLDMQNIPFSEALRYLGDQAGVEFAVEAGEVTVRRIGSASAAQAAKGDKATATRARHPRVQWAGRLAKGPEAVKNGHNIHRATGGEVQYEKSGYIKRRTLSGWATERHPKQTIAVNCVKPSVCKPPGCTVKCGCNICTCRGWISPTIKPGQ